MSQASDPDSSQPPGLKDETRFPAGDRAINILIGLILAGVALRALTTLFPTEDPYRWAAAIARRPLTAKLDVV